MAIDNNFKGPEEKWLAVCEIKKRPWEIKSERKWNMKDWNAYYNQRVKETWPKEQNKWN